MKKRKRFFICVLTGILACSGCLTASADSTADAGKLKSGLLLNERNNYQYNIFDYNTNNDQSVNVLDLCRSKAYALEENKKTTQSINISCLRPWVTSDGSIITIPVNIKGNTEGVSSLSFFIEYNNWYFKLDSAYSSYGQVSYSSVNDYVQFTSYDGKNVTEECNIVYLVFSTVPDVPYSTYEFNLSDIQGTVLDTDGTQRELSDKEYNSDSATLKYAFSRESAPSVTVTALETTVTDPPETTPVSWTEPPAEDKLSFNLDNAELSSDGRRLKIPVYMQMNTTGLCSLNTIVRYDTNRFSLIGVSQGDFSGYGYVGGNKDNAVFNTFNSENISSNSGVIAYFEFDINEGAGSGVYEFELTDIKAYYSENWNQQEVPQDKRNDRSEVYRYSFKGGSVTTTVTEQTTVTTTATTTSDTTTTTAVTTTTPWEPPVTTTTTTPWKPPATEPSVSADSIELEALEMIQAWRRELNLSELIPNQTLFDCADIRTADLKQSYSATRPDGSTRKELLMQMGAPNSISSSEFYCRGYKSASAMISQFKSTVIKAPGHSVEDGSFVYIGIGYSDGYWSVILT